MYYPYGWPRLLRMPQESVRQLEQVVCNRDKILAAVLTSDSILIWHVKPCVPIISHRRSPSNVRELGKNALVRWRPDSAMIVVVTEFGRLIIYHLVVPTDMKTLYELVDPPTPSSLRRINDELFVKEMIPPLIFSLAFEVEVEGGGVADLAAVRDELMVATKDGKILRYSWDGHEIRDYSLDLKRIPFCSDQQVLRAVPLVDDGVHVSDIAYSPLVGGYAVVFNDGRAALLVASTLGFDPNTVTGIWALHLEDASCVALNHKYKLITFGRKNSEGVAYSVDETTGGLVVSHRLVVPSRDYPGRAGAASCVRWTPDGTAVAMCWERGGFSVWSTFGSMIVCSLGWDLGVDVSDPVRQNPLRIKSMDWSAEGYQLWVVNAAAAADDDDEPEDFAPFPREEEQRNEPRRRNLANKAVVIQFVKSPTSVNPSASKQTHVYLQGEDRLHLNVTRDDRIGGSAENKRWTTVTVPHGYIGTSWPIRLTAMDDGSGHVAVAGRTGFAHYSVASRRWRLFGNETQEKDFIVTGGLLWWRDAVVMGCYNLASLRDEIRMYPRAEKLDNRFAEVVGVEAQVLMLNSLDGQLVSYGADGFVTIFDLTTTEGGGGGRIAKVRSYDASAVPGLGFHPACVSLIGLSTLKIETQRGCGGGPSDGRDPPSIILNVCGRVVMLQQHAASSELSLPTVLASGCETIWFPRSTSAEKPHLTASLWLYCGAHGMKVWLPVFPREEDHGHTFMSKRIMLHFPLDAFYPLAVLFEDAIILGAENETVLHEAPGISTAALPYSSLQRKSLPFLHLILRQLIRRNLGYHAWEIARTCATLPYFQHGLELLLHEVLEEEATSTEPTPDALLPSVVDFIQEFPVFRKTVGGCARKTEAALWRHLFAAVGSPRVLFDECLDAGDLETAGLYLLILQNLEPPSVAQNRAASLLRAALRRREWELAAELVRFLRTIDPEEEAAATASRIRTVSSPPPQNDGGASAAAAVEEISLLLGTLQVPRGKAAAAAAAADPALRGVQRTRSDSKPPRPRLMSSSDDFCDVDAILRRHAERLLVDVRLKDLGTFSARLHFDLVVWLKKEETEFRTATNFVSALKRIHDDFEWPFPAASRPPEVPDDDGDNGRTVDSGYLSEDPPPPPPPEVILSDDDAATTASDDWSSTSTVLPAAASSSSASRPHKSEVQLRHLLRVAVESDSLELASLLSVALRDSPALIRVVDSVLLLPSSSVVSTVYQNLKAIEAWAQSECHGYNAFFHDVQPQLDALRSYLLNQPNANVAFKRSAVNTSPPPPSLQRPHRRDATAPSTALNKAAAAEATAATVPPGPTNEEEEAEPRNPSSQSASNCTVS